MTDPDPQPSLLRFIDTECRRFEDAWRAGRQPRIEDWIADLNGLERRELLRELLILELNLNRESNTSAIWTEFETRFPGDTEIVRQAISEEALVALRAQQEDANQPHEPNADALHLPTTVIGTSADQETPPQINATATEWQIPGYQIIRQLGKGGMGTVYEAIELALQRTVALKVFAIDQPGKPAEHIAELIQRFEREAATAAQLHHPSIVAVHAFGAAPGCYFISMQFIDGGSLDGRVAAGKVPPRQAAEYIRQAAEGLACAHQQGVVHRDLKPHNIMIEAHHDRALVADFGLARHSQTEADGQRLTAAGVVFGTPAYMSPEQARNSANASAASDIYSLGATLFHLLTGRPPFAAKDIANLLRKVIHDEPPLLRHDVPDIDRDIESICLKCLEKSVTDRYSSAQELAADLQCYLQDKPVRARPVTRSHRFFKLCRRNPRTTAIVAAVVIAGMFASGALHHFQSLADTLVAQLDDRNRELIHAEQQVSQQIQKAKTAIARQVAEERRAADAAATASAAVENAQAESQRAEAVTQKSKLAIAAAEKRQTDAEQYAAATQRELQSALQEKTTISRSLTALQATKNTLDVEVVAAREEIQQLSAEISRATARRDDALRLEAAARRNFEREQRRLYNLQLVRAQEFLESDLQQAEALLLDPERCPLSLRDFTWYTLMDSLKGLQFNLGNHRSPVAQIRFSTDNSKVATFTGSSVRIWDNASRQLLAELPESVAPDQGQRFWNEDGSRMLTVGANSTHLWNTVDGSVLLKVLNKRQRSSKQPLLAAMSPQGGFAVATNESNGLELFRVADGQQIAALLNESSSPVSAASFSEDDALLATVNRDKSVVVWDAASGQQQVVLPPHEFLIDAVRFSPDSSRLAVLTDHDLRVVDVKTRRTVFRSDVEFFEWRDLFFSDDGRRLNLFDSSHITVWDISSGRPLHQIDIAVPPLPGIRCLSADRRYVVGMPRGRNSLSKWDLKTGTAQEIHNFDHHEVIRYTIDANAKTLAVRDQPKPTGDGDNYHLRLFDLTTMQPMESRFYSERRTGHICLSDDGDFIGLPIDNSARIWDRRQPQQQITKNVTDADIVSLSWSPDSTSFAVGDTSHTVRILQRDAQTVTSEYQIKNHVVKQFAWSPHGQSLASLGNNGIVILRNLKTSTHSELLAEQFVGPSSIAFSPDGVLIASIDRRRRNVVLHDIAAGKTLPLPGELAQRKNLTAIAFVPGTNSIVTAGERIELYDVRDGERQPPLAAADIAAEIVTLSADGRWLVAGGRRAGGAFVWDLKSGKKIAEMRQPACFPVSLSLTPDGQTLVCVNENGDTTLWDPLTGQQRRTMVDRFARRRQTVSQTTKSQDQIRRAAFSSDGSTLIAAGNAGLLQAWHGRRASPANAKPLTWSTDGFVRFVTITTDDESILFAGVDDTIRVIDATTGGLRASFKAYVPFKDFESRLAVSGDGRLIATQNHRKQIEVRDLKTGDIVRTFLRDPKNISTMKFTHDRRLAISQIYRPVELMNISSGDVVTIPDSKGTIGSRMIFSANDEVLTVLNRSHAEVRNVTSGSLRRVSVRTLLSGSSYNAVRESQMSSDGSVMATFEFDATNGGTVQIRDVLRDRHVFRLSGLHVGGGKFAFSANGSRLAFHDGVDSVFVISTSHGTVVNRIGRTGSVPVDRPINRSFGATGARTAERNASTKAFSVTALTLSADGRLVAIGWADGAVQYVSVDNPHQRQEFSDHTGPVTALALSSAGNTGASGGQDRLVIRSQVAPAAK